MLKAYTQEFTQPLPDFIEQIYYYELKQGRLQICVYVSQGEVWELGDYAETLDEKIRSHSEFMIDGEINQLDEPGLRAGILMARSDDEGNTIGTFDSSPTDLCITKRLGDGEHQGFIKIRMPSAAEYTYSWAFHN